jgi:hypothetical protein
VNSSIFSAWTLGLLNLRKAVMVMLPRFILATHPTLFLIQITACSISAGVLWKWEALPVEHSAGDTGLF